MQDEFTEDADEVISATGEGDAGADSEDRGDHFDPNEHRDTGADTATGQQADTGDGQVDAATDTDDPNTAAGEDDARGAGQMIPKSRFDEVNNERKWLREQLAAARGQGNADADAAKGAEADEPEPYDFDAAEERYMDALFDGDREKAKEIRREINQQNREQARQESASDADRRMTERQQAEALNQAAAGAIEKYPFLDSQSDQADNTAINDVVQLRDLYIARGKSNAEALTMAADVVGRERGAAGAANASPSNQDKADKNAAAAREAEAKRRNADASNRQPPSSGGVGDRAGGEQEIDPEKMTDEEFGALSDAEKRRMRGD